MRPVAALLALMVLAAPAAASGQASDAPRPKRRAIPAAAAPPPAPAPRALDETPASARLSGLAGLGGVDDGGATCRSSCARARYTCEVQDDGCVAPWNVCLKSCGGAASSRLTTLLPR